MFQTILFVVSMVSPATVDTLDSTGATAPSTLSIISDTMLPSCDSTQSVTMFAPAPALYMRSYDWTFSKAEMRQINAAFRAGASKVDVCLDGSSIKVR